MLNHVVAEAQSDGGEDLRKSLEIARASQPDVEYAVQELHQSGVCRATARWALREVFGYDVLA